MGKIKEFWKEHRKEIVLTTSGVIVGCVAGIGVYAGLTNHTRLRVMDVNKTIVDALMPAMACSKGYSLYIAEEGDTVGHLTDIVKDFVDSSVLPLEQPITGVAVFHKDL